MKSDNHNTHKSNKEHGTVQSYILGFVLSLIFTIVPYQLVVDKILSGNVLILTILGIAVLQMFIQIFFFLHLGRGPKPLYNVVFFFATAGIIVVVIGASLLIMANLYHNMTPEEVTVRIAQEENLYQIGGEETGACQGSNNNHVVTIKNNRVSPSLVVAYRCDSLTFINEDDAKREIVFGSHPNYGSYGGLFEIEITKGRPETITLNQVGNFMFHDHIDETLVGYFSVSP